METETTPKVKDHRGGKWVAVWMGDHTVFIPYDSYVPENAPRGAGLQVLPDTIEPTWHPVTGTYCSSRTGMVKIGKEHGLEQIGNEKIPPKKPWRPDKEKTIELLKHHYEQISRGSR